MSFTAQLTNKQRRQLVELIAPKWAMHAVYARVALDSVSWPDPYYDGPAARRKWIAKHDIARGDLRRLLFALGVETLPNIDPASYHRPYQPPTRFASQHAETLRGKPDFVRVEANKVRQATIAKILLALNSPTEQPI